VVDGWPCKDLEQPPWENGVRTDGTWGKAGGGPAPVRLHMSAESGDQNTLSETDNEGKKQKNNIAPLVAVG